MLHHYYLHIYSHLVHDTLKKKKIPILSSHSPFRTHNRIKKRKKNMFILSNAQQKKI